MKRLDFIKKIGVATVGLPLLSSFGLPKAYLSVADQEEREKLDLNLYKEMEGKDYIIKPNGNIIHSMSKGDPSVYYEIINDSTFIMKRFIGIQGSESFHNLKFKFKKFSPKPDSTSVYIR